jgi:predicted transcriptional regulator
VAYHQLNRFLEVGTADIVAAFADELDRTSQAKIEAIAARLKAIRQARESE